MTRQYKNSRKGSFILKSIQRLAKHYLIKLFMQDLGRDLWRGTSSLGLINRDYLVYVNSMIECMGRGETYVHNTLAL